ncbi:PTS sugar transporter subunit IIC [Enterococcus faecium]|nr:MULTISPECIES: PTS transporter subunit EIIC [Enterococcaceae]EJE4563065.1 PTS sugar transporter subunit IIC [Enterococcus faecium]EKY7883010.1 PTS sugar transporter subunit IIC [Enterococcus faecium]EKZ0059255.1 PTS sugar transporter subunit IIC [Enterococcus faecium]EKZ0497297.1 PTS sugar transporter subunit IIC [Enterococcus faecium]MBG7725280.1 PTS sugar transporter subunit IIC [Enterococcus faecium]
MGNLINEKVIPAVLKFTSTKAIRALKDGMMYTMPFLIVGSIFLLLANIPIPIVANWVNGNRLGIVFSQIFQSSFNLMAFFAVIGISYTYIKNEGIQASLAGSLTALSAFVLLIPSSVATEDGNLAINVISKDWTSGKGMICAIVIGLGVGWLYSFCMKKNLRIKMPDGVPQGVADSFAALVPAGITLTITGLLFAVFYFVTNSSFAEFIYKMVQTPLQGITDSFWGVVIMAMIMSLLWWVGVHGGNICGAILSPILQSNMADNQAIIDSGKELSIANGGHIFTQQFWDNFLCMTGAGIVIGLVLFITFFAKSKQLKELGKLAFIPNLFNINEPIIFGVPIVMNLYLLLPFVLVPILVGASSYILMSLGILPLFTGVMVPWTTPPVISGFLIGGWRVALWQFIIIVSSIAIYYPFIKKVDLTLAENEL